MEQTELPPQTNPLEVQLIGTFSIDSLNTFSVIDKYDPNVLNRSAGEPWEETKYDGEYTDFVITAPDMNGEMSRYIIRTIGKNNHLGPQNGWRVELIEIEGQRLGRIINPDHKKWPTLLGLVAEVNPVRQDAI
ncbi:hypothetical protein KC726_05315 [Candidatus Woesebacteria bacterium]|nr:hypothetical protein [Candidatus Woesebacteria bacterium]